MSENQSKLLSPKGNNSQYIWAVVGMTLIGSVLALATLWLRPASDPLDVIAQIMKGLAPTTAGILALMKAQETHLSVNSRLDEFIRAQGTIAQQQGVGIGEAKERARAEESRATSIGPPGKQGDTGAQGVQGAQGARGETGEHG